MIDTNKRFTPDLATATKDNSYYALTMFPYPSGSGLHAGHASVFTINDVAARYQRMQGKTVFNPFGFDSFGLPAENYAMKQGKPAYQVTEENKEHFIKQIQALNISFDYERVLLTSDADYYKRTQWIFSKLYAAGLVYRDELRVNRCPDCQTVLANDQVVEGKCERCKSEIVQKKMPQWFIKITDYADRLIADLDLIDWPQETKTAQKNWIGRKEGINIHYEIKDHPGETISVFTTRPDTNFGATFVVLAPDSDFVEQYRALFPNQEVVNEYIKKALAKTTVERLKDGKKKSGVFTGLSVINKLNNKELPLYIGDFVLADVGTGAVVGVPGHDQRDFDFAKAMGIEVVRVVVGPDGNMSDITSSEQVQEAKGTMINSGFLNGLDIHDAKEKIKDYLEEKSRGERIISYKLRDRSVSRQRYRGSPIPVYYDEEGNTHLIPESELPVKLPLDIQNYKPKGKSPLEEHPTFPHYQKDGKTYTRECDTLDTFMCSAFYFLRYPNVGDDTQLISKELADKLFPINLYTGGKEHTVGHLLYSRFIHKFLYDQGYVSCPEPFAKLVHQGMVLGNDGRKMGKRYGNGVDPLEIVEQYGADAVRTYMMFMGPVEQDKIWNENALNGMRKFLGRVEKLTPQSGFTLWMNEAYTMSPPTDQESAQQIVLSAYHQTIIDITSDLERLKYNTAVSKIMILVNTIYEQGIAPHEVLLGLCKFIALFATELGDRMRAALGQTDDVQFGNRPVADESKIVQSSITLPVQINGKVRANIEITPGSSEEAVLELAKQEDNVLKYLEGKTVRKVIFKEDRILNIVVG